jgi:hypothetical protein
MILIHNNAIGIADSDGTSLEVVAPWAADILEIHNPKFYIVFSLVYRHFAHL